MRKRKAEGGSSIAGEIRNPDSRPAIAARVSLAPGNRIGDSAAGGLPGIQDTLTDSDGRFELRSPGKILRIADFEDGMGETPFAAGFPKGSGKVRMEFQIRAAAAP